MLRGSTDPRFSVTDDLIDLTISGVQWGINPDEMSTPHAGGFVPGVVRNYHYHPLDVDDLLGFGIPVPSPSLGDISRAEHEMTQMLTNLQISQNMAKKMDNAVDTSTQTADGSVEGVSKDFQTDQTLDPGVTTRRPSQPGPRLWRKISPNFLMK